MNRMTAMLLLALLTTAGGCFGGDGDTSGPTGGPPPPPPPPPPPSTSSVEGIWVGELEFEVDDEPGTRSSLAVRVLVTGDGAFRWILDDPNQQIVGTFVVNDRVLNASYGLFWYEYPWWLTSNADSQAWVYLLDGTVEERVSLSGGFNAQWLDSTEYKATFSLAYDPLYERGSSHAKLAGTYVDSEESLTVDASGTLFYQSSRSGCVGNGSANLINTDFNLYSVSFAVGNCTGNDGARNGRSYTGLAYLADSSAGARDDVLEIAMSLPLSEYPPHEGVTDPYIWNLRIRR